MKFLKFSKVLATILASSNLFLSAPLKADGVFQPTKLAIDFYEIGLRNSTTEKLMPVFKNDNGLNIDLVSGAGEEELANGISLDSTGTYDQMYVLTSNSPVISGNDGDGCYIKAGSYEDNDGEWAAATTDSSLAGDATLTETGFGGSDSDYGPVNPAVTTYFNGTQTTSLVEYLVNGDNKTPGAGGTLNRYLFVGVLANSIDLSQVKEGTVWISVETSDTSEMSESCTVYEWNNTKFTLSVE